MLTNADFNLLKAKAEEMEARINTNRTGRIAHISLAKIVQDTCNPVNYDAEYIKVTKIFIQYLIQEYDCRSVDDFIRVINSDEDYLLIMGYIRTNSVADNSFLKGDFTLYAMLLEEQVTTGFGRIRGVGKTSRWTMAEHKEMIAMREAGITYKEIAAAFNANQSTITNAIRRYELGEIKNFKVKKEA